MGPSRRRDPADADLGQGLVVYRVVGQVLARSHAQHRVIDVRGEGREHLGGAARGGPVGLDLALSEQVGDAGDGLDPCGVPREQDRRQHEPRAQHEGEPTGTHEPEEGGDDRQDHQGHERAPGVG